jgi:hypothetical protein
VCFGGDLGTSLRLVEKALVQGSPRFESICSSFGFLSLSSLGETGVTGFGKRSDRFYCGSKCSSCFPLRVSSVALLGLSPRSSSTPVAAWTWQEKRVEVHERNWVHRPNS